MKNMFLGFLLLATAIVSAQDKPKEVLFTIDDKPYYTDEFERVYKKNLDLVKDESQKDLNQYLELFVGYKLKVNKANRLGLQNNDKYKNELKSYRTQLSKNYTSDSKVTAELVNEGYERMKKEIKASHISILADENFHSACDGKLPEKEWDGILRDLAETYYVYTCLAKKLPPGCIK